MAETTPSLTRPGRAEQMFPTLTPGQIARVARHGRARPFAAGDVLFEVGHTSRPLLRDHERPGGNRPAVPHGGHRRHHPRGRRIHRRSQPALGPPVARPGAGGRRRRGDRARSRESPVARADRRRAQRDRHARVHPAPRGAHRERARRRRAGRLDPLRGHAARQGVPDAQRPSVHVDRSRSGRRGAGAAGSLPRDRRGRARADLPRRTSCCAIRPIGRSPTASASTRPSTAPRSATSSSSAPGRRGWRPRCTARPKGSTCWWWRPTRRAARPDRARRSRTISAFRPGISGQELAGRAYTQAQKFGAQIVIAKGARALACARRPYAVEIDEDLRVPARAVIIATGAAYRRLDLDEPVAIRGRRASTTARRRSKRSCAAARRSSSSAAATRPARRRCSWRRRPRQCTCSCARPGWPTRCRATWSGASRTTPRSRCRPTRRSSRSRAIGTSSASTGGTSRAATSRRATSGTSSS